jgi:hypothetical protein
LCALEGLALRWSWVERFVLERHARAVGALIVELSFEPRQIAIVGGGLFPRSFLLLRRIYPNASFSIIDKSVRNVARARAYLAAHNISDDGVTFLIDTFDATRHVGFDLVVTPLAYVGCQRELARVVEPAALLSHDWIWRCRGDASAVISWFLLKRVNLSIGRR